MRLKTNHKNSEINSDIMDWLYDHTELKGNEDQLAGEPFTAFLAPSEIWNLETFLSVKYDEAIELPKDLCLIELK